MARKAGKASQAKAPSQSQKSSGKAKVKASKSSQKSKSESQETKDGGKKRKKEKEVSKSRKKRRIGNIGAEIKNAKDDSDEDSSDEEEEEDAGESVSLARAIREIEKKSEFNKLGRELLDDIRHFAVYLMMTVHPFIDWIDVFAIKQALESKLTRNMDTDKPMPISKFQKKYATHLLFFQRLMDDFPEFKEEYGALRAKRKMLTKLAKYMDAFRSSNRSLHFGDLKLAVLAMINGYLRIKDPNTTDYLDPFMDEVFRGFNNPIISDFFIVSKHVEEYEQNPAAWRRRYRKAQVALKPGQMPLFLWHNELYDPSNPEDGLLQGHLMFLVWLWLFKGQSACKEIKLPYKSQSSIAKRHEMKTVPIGFIGYTAMILWWSLSTMEDWRRRPENFLEEFFNGIVSLASGKDKGMVAWWTDLNEWWDRAVLGVEVEEDNEDVESSEEREGSDASESETDFQRVLRFLSEQSNTSDTLADDVEMKSDGEPAQAKSVTKSSQPAPPSADDTAHDDVHDLPETQEPVTTGRYST
ncbi:hypothetical protein BKA70DRAFT_1324613 [Coprinopsis sp. MPI-PUGE-AT-0042]|nr:hypothetical protein BKA70DRAFT_1324613 [Coprinopsis sp. MPI-PUGE-AT-0042]